MVILMVKENDDDDDDLKRTFNDVYIARLLPYPGVVASPMGALYCNQQSELSPPNKGSQIQIKIPQKISQF